NALANREYTADDFARLADLAKGIGFPRHLPLLPSALICYRRERFIDPASGARISIDSGIHCGWFNLSLAPLTAPAVLGAGVLEVKGATRHLPRSLEPVASLLFKYSFSKYAQCLEKISYPREVRI